MWYIFFILKNDAAPFDQIQHNHIDHTPESETEPRYKTLRALLWRMNHFNVVPIDLLSL